MRANERVHVPRGGVCRKSRLRGRRLRGLLRTVLANVVDLIRFHAVAGAEVHPNLNLSNPQAARLPYGVAIAAGVLYSAVAFYRRGGI